MIVHIEGRTTEIKEPRPATLKKYGLELDDWKELLAQQGYRCPICKHIPSTGRFVVDHFHAQGYKKMSPEKKRKYIRGILCSYCNHWHVAKGITIERAENVVTYLKNYEARRPR